MPIKNKNTGYLLLSIVFVLSIILLLFKGKIIQDNAYHNFSDQATILGIPNFWNVTSNIPFLIIGILGIYKIKNRYYTFLFTSISLVGIGSSFYHLAPDNSSLIWDRLPMTLFFMSLFSVILKDFISEKIGSKLFAPLIALGIISIVYWVIYNDLRVYAFVQFYPMIAIPIILLFFKSKSSNSSVYWVLFSSYLVAKFLEFYDVEIHSYLNFISGHSLKHIISALGIYLFLKDYLKTNSKYTRRVT